MKNSQKSDPWTIASDPQKWPKIDPLETPREDPFFDPIFDEKMTIKSIKVIIYKKT